MYAQTEFTAHCIANILQNMSQNRSNKRITLKDVKYAILLGSLIRYPGKTLYCFPNTSYHIYGHFAARFVHCIKGLGNGEASVLWRVMYTPQRNMTPEDSISFGTRGNHGDTMVPYTKKARSSVIYKDLKINKDEIKILVECYSLYIADNNYYFSDGRKCSDVSPREAFGFFVLRPTACAAGFSATQKPYFTSVVIFTPKPGLFNENPPN
jgi:hypothetical protein